MKKTLAMALSALAALGTATYAGTYTWTGNGNDGLWFSAGNWNYDGEPAASAPARNTSDDIVIGNGDDVEYVPGGDWEPSGTVVISGGSRLYQTTGNAWPNIHGTLILDGGTYEPGTAGRLRIYGTLVMRNNAVIGAAPEYEFGSATVFEVGTGCAFSFTNKGSGQTLRLTGGDVAVSGTFTTNPDDQFTGGTLTVGGETISTAGTTFSGGTLVFNGEFRPRDGTVFDGADVTVRLFSPNTANTVFTIRCGSVKLASNANDGYWRAETSAYLDFPSSSTGALIVPYAYDAETSASTIYNRYFSGSTPYIRVAGAPVGTLDDFKNAIQLSDAGQGEFNGATISYTRIELVPPEAGAPVFDSHTASAAVAEGVVSATFSATLAEAGEPAATLTLVYGTVNGGTSSPDDWQNKLALTNPGSGQAATTSVTGLDGVAVYWYAFVASNETAAVWTAPESILTPPSSPDEVVWIGTSASTDSRVAANWLPARVPTATDTVVVTAPAAVAGSLHWYPDTGSGTVAAWRQPADGGSYPVYFHTTNGAPLTVSGDVTLLSGTWTHDGPAAEPAAMLNVLVGGDLTVGPGASIQTGIGDTGADVRARGFQRAAGPGYDRSAGAAHAGDGGHGTVAMEGTPATYGSILNPATYGSGGWGDGTQYAGGGVIRIVVDGDLTVDGTICSRGFGYALWGDFVGGAGSGGSVNIAATSISGSGRIDANGGNNGGYGPGSGGRVRIALTGAGATFADFTGRIEAVGGSMQNATDAAANDIAPAAAGTVCLVASGARPVVKVYNVWRYGGTDAEWRVPDDPGVLPSATHLPAMQGGDGAAALKTTDWELTGHGAIRLTADTRIASLSIAASDGSQRIYTDGHALQVNSLRINGTELRSGRYTAAELPAIVKGAGYVEVAAQRTVIFLR